MTLSVASVTVLYNSGAVLPRHLAALRDQSHRLDEIIVVDNASTDSTPELLRGCRDVTAIRLPRNTGVGGGLSTGLDYAVSRGGYQWVWLLDADSVPRHDALEKLLGALERVMERDKVGVLAPVALHSDTKISYPGMLWRHGWVAVSPEDSGREICLVDAVITSGSLVRGEAVRRVGLPRDDFFMDFVDFEHCLRFRRAGYDIAVVCDSLMEHSNGEPRIVSFLGYSYPWADHAPWREYYACRNQVFTIWDYYPDWRSKLSIVLRLSRHALGILLIGRQKWACLRSMYLGFVEGRAGKLGFREPSELGLCGSSRDGTAA
jgi:GT2 family glycosyltransferase